MQEDFKTIGAWFKRATIVITLFLLTACANLESVRDFAKHSASLTCGTEVIDYWGKWDERSERFDAVIKKLPQKADQPLKGPIKPKSLPTKEELQEIKALQSVLSAYLSKLGSLADDSITDVSKQVEGLVGNLNKLPSDMSEEKRKQVNAAYGEIIKLVKLPLDAYRHYKVRELIRENDDNIQAITEGLSIAIDSVAKFSDAEKNSVINWYDIITGTYPPQPNFSSAYQWEKDRAAIIEIYKGKTTAIIAYKEAILTIGASHSKMAKELSSVSTESFKRLVVSLINAKEQIDIAREKYRKAFEK